MWISYAWWYLPGSPPAFLPFPNVIRLKVLPCLCARVCGFFKHRADMKPCTLNNYSLTFYFYIHTLRDYTRCFIQVWPGKVYLKVGRGTLTCKMYMLLACLQYLKVVNTWNEWRPSVALLPLKSKMMKQPSCFLGNNADCSCWGRTSANER